MLVIDSSAIASLFFPEKYSGRVEEALGRENRILTLDLAFYEVGNVIRKRMVRKEIKPAEGKTILEGFIELASAFEVHNYSVVLSEALNLAVENNITLYDASFLQLAVKSSTKLLTTDIKLINSISNRFHNYLIML